MHMSLVKYNFIGDSLLFYFQVCYPKKSRNKVLGLQLHHQFFFLVQLTIMLESEWQLTRVIYDMLFLRCHSSLDYLHRIFLFHPKEDQRPSTEEEPNFI